MKFDKDLFMEAIKYFYNKYGVEFVFSDETPGADDAPGLAAFTIYNDDTYDIIIYWRNFPNIIERVAAQYSKRVETIRVERLKKLIYNVLRHEVRHYEQYVWLSEHGIDPNNELGTWNGDEESYLNNPLEKDAFNCQKGIELPIEDAMMAIYGRR